MSEIMTTAGLPGCWGGGFMERGRKSRAEMIAILRKRAADDLQTAQRILSAADSDFDVRVVRGVHMQRLIERLEP